MTTPAKPRERQAGQTLVLFVLVFTVLALMIGVVIDGGYGMAQRRQSQNASDFAALAGARIVAEWLDGNTVDGTDRNVQDAIDHAIATNGGEPIDYGANPPLYIDAHGNTVGTVGSGKIPQGTFAVRVTSSRAWKPFFLGLIPGVTDWMASAAATARAGWAMNPPAGGVFPAGISEQFFDGRTPCSGALGSSSACEPVHLTPDTNPAPGAFGWLKFGCPGYGLGQDSNGCGDNAQFLNAEIGPPSISYGCCTRVGLPGSADKIGNLPGNKAEADCSGWLGKTVTIAVWDIAASEGENAFYHIVGFAGFQITACPGAKNLDGVWRQRVYAGPTTTTPGFAWQDLAVELIQ